MLDSRLILHRLLGVALALLCGGACEPPAHPPVAQSQPGEIAPASVPSDARPDSALGYPTLPDPAKTPGVTLDVTAADVCTPGYSKRVRDVPSEVKRQVYASYGVRRREPGEYEIDHLINLSIGGSNSIRNLWPQSFRTSPWNAYVKDELENELHRRVCAGTIDLATAQRVIAHNWVAGYRMYVSPTPLPIHARARENGRHRRYIPRAQSQPQGPVP